jgi:outer membrane protein OmpA-like peptidoglycan-associated protein
VGKSKPIAPNAKPDGSDDPEGRAKNRRVEIVVRKG